MHQEKIEKSKKKAEDDENMKKMVAEKNQFLLERKKEKSKQMKEKIKEFAIKKSEVAIFKVVDMKKSENKMSEFQKQELLKLVTFSNIKKIFFLQLRKQILKK